MQRAKKPEGGKVLSATEYGTKPTQRTPVSGVRRVWGTLKSTTTAAVRSTLKKLWPASDGLVMRRRVREYGASNKTRSLWWFILKGDENTLKKLENEWAPIRMQTNWKLEHCTAPNNQPVANNGNPAVGESNSHTPENTSASSTSIAATSPGITVATIPNQVTDTQTDVDNSASQSVSQSQHDDTDLDNFCNSLMLTQVVTEATHVSSAGNHTLIDLAFLSHPQLLKQCRVTPPLGTSDHNCIHLSVTHQSSTSKPSKKKKKSQRTIWRYQQADFDRAIELLDEINWEDLLNGDIDQMWTTWENRFMAIMHQCIPATKPKADSKAPWINKDITKAIRARILSFRCVKRTGRPDHQNDYKKKLNNVANMIKNAKSRYFKQLNPSNPKTFWKLVKRLSKTNICHPNLEGFSRESNS